MDELLRYERKFRVENLSPAQARQLVRLHPAGFVPLYPDRQVNNIYFDTPDFAAYQLNNSGVAQRTKYRVRWYGEAQLARVPAPTLEIKVKDGELGYKRSYPHARDLDWMELAQPQLVWPELRMLGLLPVLVNSYQRAYLATPDGRFRLTIDWNLGFSPYQPQGPVNLPPTATDPAVVYELKYTAADDQDAARVLAHLPFRQTKNSKYVTGVNLLFY